MLDTFCSGYPVADDSSCTFVICIQIFIKYKELEAKKLIKYLHKETEKMLKDAEQKFDN